jgi:MFS superfamily sulfate permease-like transporter
MPRIPAALVVSGLAIVVVALFNLEDRGVEVIGDIPAGLPSLAWPGLSLEQWFSLVPGALAIVVVAFAESIAAARSYAREHGYKVDADQEMIALGASNAASGLVGAFVVDGSLSKTAAGDQAGQKTQLAALALSAAVFITILLLTGLFYSLPEATLGAIVIHAVWHLIDFEKVNRYARFRREDFYAGAAALLGVLFFDILAGLLIAVAASFVLLLARVSRPEWKLLGRIRDEESDDIAYQALDRHPDAETFPGLLIARFDGALFFANANVFADDVRNAIAAAEPKPRVVLLDGESVNDVDATALDAIGELHDELQAEDIELWVARLKASVQETADRDEDFEVVRRFPSVRAAVVAFQEEVLDTEPTE